MIDLAFAIVVAAALMGTGLAVLYARGPAAKRPHAVIPLVHGALGAAGFVLLIAVLRHGLPATDTGTGDFGVIAGALFGLALAFGGLIAFAAWRGRRPAGLLVATHAGVAIAGFVVLLTLVVLR
ncbi:MAG: hypothetical protein KGL11_04105 [Alphaproteobacteria bacterium]|nr:hypothetical protein [Alphaproteobacteria bacterium]